MQPETPRDPTETSPPRNPPEERPRGVFVTGNDTGVGKTFAACQIAKSLVAQGRRVGVYKPVASGCRRQGSGLISEEATLLWEAAGKPKTLNQVCPQVFEAALAPNLAAKAEGKSVDEDLLRTGAALWFAEFDFTIVEGAGGYFSPLGDTLLNADLAIALGLPVLLVVENRLGAIHQALCSVHAIKTYRTGLPVLGVIVNDVARKLDSSATTNLGELRTRLGDIPVAHLQQGERSGVAEVVAWI